MSSQTFRRDSRSSAFMRGFLDGLTSPLNIFPTEKDAPFETENGVEASFRNVKSLLNKSFQQAVRDQNVRRNR